MPPAHRTAPPHRATLHHRAPHVAPYRGEGMQVCLPGIAALPPWRGGYRVFCKVVPEPAGAGTALATCVMRGVGSFLAGGHQGRLCIAVKRDARKQASRRSSPAGRRSPSRKRDAGGRRQDSGRRLQPEHQACDHPLAAPAMALRVVWMPVSLGSSASRSATATSFTGGRSSGTRVALRF